jgi:hypothetical protein
MRNNVLVFALLGLGGCWFAKDIPPPPSDVLNGGMYQFTQCNYTLTTPNNASAPSPNDDYLGDDPTPTFVHITIDGDPAHAMAMLWRTNDEDAMNYTRATKVAYGVNGATDTIVEGATFMYLGVTNNHIRIHESHICGLMPDTVYTYKVGGGPAGAEVWSKTYTFRTAPDKTDASAMVTALILGDTRGGYATWGMALDSAFAKASPDVIFFSGDAVTLGPTQDEWDTWFMTGGDRLAQTPFSYCHGNHDISSVNYFAQFAQPGDEQNFDFDFGPLHLAIANDTPIDMADLTGMNATLLDQHLANGSGAPWLIEMNHKPLWTAAAGPHPEDQLPVRMAWQPIIDKYKVDIVFNGHDHDYERTKPMRGATAGTTQADGTTYVIAGTAGAQQYPNGTNYWTAVSQMTYNFLIVTIRVGQLQVNAYRTDGTTLDTVTLTKP